MDTDLLKLAISVVSALVALFSAIFAYRVRKQTRIDLFDTQRDLLLLSMSENDIRLKTLEFKIALLKTQLSKAAASRTGASNRIADVIKGLDDLNDVVRGLRMREWSEEQVQLFSEAAIVEIRRRTLHEQVLSKTIQAEVHSLVLNDAEAELVKLQHAT